VNWLWLNIPLMAAFFLAVTGIPMWMVFRHPDTGPVTVTRQARAKVAVPARPELASAMTPAAAHAAGQQLARGRAERELAGAWR
jgi:hypothetical protein